MNVASWLKRAAVGYGKLAAVAVGDRTVLDYQHLAARTACLAEGFRGTLGLEPGDRVALVAKNHPAYIEALFGAWWAGLVAVPVNPRLHSNEVAWIVAHSGARAVFCSPELEPELGGVDLSGVKALLPFGGEEHERLAHGKPAPLANSAPDDLAWLFYTSGTTGRPKGAMLSHRNLATMSLAHLAEVDPTTPGDALLHCAPLSHGSGLYALPHLCAMGVSVIPESGGFDPLEVEALAARWPKTSFFAAPTMVRRLTHADIALDTTRLRTLVWGGAPMHVADTIEALERFGPCLAQIYGQGESPMTITALSKREIGESDHPRWRERLASAGTVRAAVEVRVADEQDEPLPIGEPGEVLVRGDTVAAGYWEDPEASAVTLRGGWLHTGDIGVFDEHGYLTLLDRSNDLIVSGGSNIYPREVEEVLIEHPDVREVAVIGRPDPDWGEIVVAYVAGEASAAELDQLCLGRIARFKRPKDYIFVHALPTNNYGKVVKRELRDEDALRNAPTGEAAR